MVEGFSFNNPGKLIFGEGSVGSLPDLTDPDSALLVCGQSFLSNQKSRLLTEKIKFIKKVSGEPSPDLVDSITNDVKGKIKSVIAIGGGSVLDTGKAVAAMCCTEGSVEKYLEGVGTALPPGETLPLVAVPTTAGTGSEATKNAVISRRGPGGYKKSLRHDNYIPAIAVIDPDLYLSCPAPLMASCGMDAFSQLLESYISTKANIYTDTLALKGLNLFIENFMNLFYSEEKDTDAMGAIAFAAYLSGITLANAGLGTVHGIAGPIGGLYPVPHGTACGTLLPAVMRKTVEELEKQEEERSPIALEKMDRLGQLIGKGNRYLLLETLDQWLETLNIPGLSSFQIREEDIPVIAESSGNKNNPYAFSQKQIEEILKERL
jgi:alcohol dehydrogenase class IV